MKKTELCLWGLVLMFMFGGQRVAYAQDTDNIIIATGQEVPTDDGLSEEYSFPAGYQENAVQFLT